MNKTPEPEDEPGIALGVCLMGVSVALLIAALVLHTGSFWSDFRIRIGIFFIGGRTHPAQPGAESIAGGLFFMYVGLLFLLGYYFSHKTFFLRWLISGCEDATIFGFSPGRKLMLIYAAIFIGIGGWGFYIGIS